VLKEHIKKAILGKYSTNLDRIIPIFQGKHRILKDKTSQTKHIQKGNPENRNRLCLGELQ